MGYFSARHVWLLEDIDMWFKTICFFSICSMMVSFPMLSIFLKDQYRIQYAFVESVDRWRHCPCRLRILLIMQHFLITRDEKSSIIMNHRSSNHHHSSLSTSTTSHSPFALRRLFSGQCAAIGRHLKLFSSPAPGHWWKDAMAVVRIRQWTFFRCQCEPIELEICLETAVFDIDIFETVCCLVAIRG